MSRLSTRNLTMDRGENRLFSELNLSLNDGQCLHLVGPNGSGKSTLLRILCGLIHPDTGGVLFNGESIYAHPEYLQQMVFLGHKNGLKGELTAIENLRIYQSILSTTDESLLDQILHQLGLLESADKTTQALSFGQQRRLAFARLLLAKSKIWLLDEPFTGIDSNGRSIIERLCLEHLENDGCIVLSHHQTLSDSLLAEHVQVLALSS